MEEGDRKRDALIEKQEGKKSKGLCGSGNGWEDEMLYARGLCAQAQTNLIMVLLPWRQPEVPGLPGPPEWRWPPVPEVGPLKAGQQIHSLFSSIQLDGVGQGGPHSKYLTLWRMTSSLTQSFHWDNQQQHYCGFGKKKKNPAGCELKGGLIQIEDTKKL